MGLVQQKLHEIMFPVAGTGAYSSDFLVNFRDSPATRLLDIIWTSFERSPEGVSIKISRHLSLETLVNLSSFCELKNPRDAIFSLLNLANDLKSSTSSRSTASIVADYSMSVLDVFSQFVLHCCRSGSLDIICRPWTPPLTSGAYTCDEIRQFQEV